MREIHSLDMAWTSGETERRGERGRGRGEVLRRVRTGFEVRKVDRRGESKEAKECKAINMESKEDDFKKWGEKERFYDLLFDSGQNVKFFKNKKIIIKMSFSNLQLKSLMFA